MGKCLCVFLPESDVSNNISVMDLFYYYDAVLK